MTNLAIRLPRRAGPQELFAQGIRSLLQLSQGLPIAGWEVSCRITPGGVSANRLLLGFDTYGVSQTRLDQAASALGMPPALAEEFQQDIAQASRVMLAVDATQSGLERRAYQCFEDRSIGIRGFKWLAHDIARYRVTDYIKGAAAPESIIDFYKARQGLYAATGVGLSGPVYEAAAQVVRSAIRARALRSSIDFFSAEERSGQRASTCFRLYESGQTFAHIQPVVAWLLAQYRLESQQLQVEGLMSRRALGWIAAGEDASGLPFFTVYGQASVLDARRMMALGAGR